MSTSTTTGAQGSNGLGGFERFLTVWVTLAILAGIGLGLVVPGVFEQVADLEVANVNLVVAALIWLMIYPMMLKVEPDCLNDVRRRPKGLVLTLIINWLVKPFTMAGLAYLFFRFVFADFVPAGEADEYIAGMILLGVAPCTAMVFVWSQLTNGNPNYTLAQVSINDLILVFAFAPIAGLLLGVTDLTVPWATLIASVAIFVVVPLGAGLATRSSLLRKDGPEAVDTFAARLKATSIIGLLLTVVLLFGFQAETIIDQPARVLMIAVPLLIQSYGIFAIGYGAARVLRLALRRCCSCSDDRHIQLFRTGRSSRYQSLRPRIRGRSGHRGRRADRGARDAVAGLVCQQNPELVPSTSHTRSREVATPGGRISRNDTLNHFACNSMAVPGTTLLVKLVLG